MHPSLTTLSDYDTTTVSSIKRKKKESAKPLDFDWIYTGTNEIIFNRDLIIPLAAKTDDFPC